MKAIKYTAVATAVSAALMGGMSVSVNAAEVRTDNRLQITSEDKQFSVRLRARVHADANLYQNDEFKHDSGAYIRRARIGVEGHAGDWNYEVTFDNATNAVDLKDAYLSTKLGPGTILFGQAKTYEGLETLTSSNAITFIERSFVGNLTSSRQVGIRYTGGIESVGYGFNVYSLREASEYGARAVGTGYGTSGRLFFTPINSGGNSLHLGVSYAREYTGDDGERSRVRPAGRSNDERFVVFDRRGEKVDITRTNLELAAVMGAFSAQAEYMMGSNSTDTRPDDDFTAWYLQASYAFGSPRRYDANRGRMRAPSAPGTWELAARYQQAERDITNQKVNVADFGVTYIANQNVLYKVNYSKVLKNDQTNDDNTGVIALRAQWAF